MHTRRSKARQSQSVCVRERGANICLLQSNNSTQKMIHIYFDLLVEDNTICAAYFVSLNHSRTETIVARDVVRFVVVAVVGCVTNKRSSSP